MDISTNSGTNLPGFRLRFVHPLLEPVNFILGFVQRLLRLLLLQLKFAQSALTAFQFLANLLHIRHGFVALGVQTGHAGLTPLVFVLKKKKNSNETNRLQSHYQRRCRSLENGRIKCGIGADFKVFPLLPAPGGLSKQLKVDPVNFPSIRGKVIPTGTPARLRPAHPAVGPMAAAGPWLPSIFPAAFVADVEIALPETHSNRSCVHPIAFDAFSIVFFRINSSQSSGGIIPVGFTEFLPAGISQLKKKIRTQLKSFSSRLQRK